MKSPEFGLNQQSFQDCLVAFQLHYSIDRKRQSFVLGQGFACSSTTVIVDERLTCQYKAQNYQAVLSTQALEGFLMLVVNNYSSFRITQCGTANA